MCPDPNTQTVYSYYLSFKFNNALINEYTLDNQNLTYVEGTSDLIPYHIFPTLFAWVSIQDSKIPCVGKDHRLYSIIAYATFSLQRSYLSALGRVRACKMSWCSFKREREREPFSFLGHCDGNFLLAHDKCWLRTPKGIDVTNELRHQAKLRRCVVLCCSSAHTVSPDA